MQKTTETRVGALVLVAILLFIYMGFKIGAFRFNTRNYNNYTLLFPDISGLSRKAEVKISGVPVGWIDDIVLLNEAESKAEVRVRVLKQYSVHADASAVVRQEGLLGSKYVEIIPGNSELPALPSGHTFPKSGKKPIEVDKLLYRFDQIASNVQEFTHSINMAVGGPEGTHKLEGIIESLGNTVQSFSQVGDIIQTTLRRNEDNLDALIGIGATVQTLSDKLENTVLPSFQESIEKISSVFDRDFNRIATGVEVTSQSLDRAAQQAQEGLASLRSVADKINQGKGLLGKIINEDDIYRDIKVAAGGFRKYADRVDRLQIVFDTHFEGMLRPAENYEFEDSKGYFNIRIYPNEYYFYLFQIATSEKGFIDRKETERMFVDLENRNPVNPTTIDPNIEQRIKDIYREQKLTFRRNSLKFGLQIGAIFKNVSLRMGLFEGFSGVAVDVEVPFKADSFRWTTTLEAFDLSGWNRKDDRRPHLKWLNKLYLMRNVYFTFGADDFVSKHNANVFVGGGIRFGDDDIKYVLGNISSVGSLGK